MPSSARPAVHAQLSGAPQPTGPIVDPAFTAPDFDIKAWINAALDAAPRHQDSPSASLNGTTPGLKSTASSLSLDMAADGSLDASLDLLQTPALDPVLGDKDQTDAHSLSFTSTPPTSQQDQKSTAKIASRSQNALLTQHATNHLTKLHILASQTSTALSSTTQDIVKLLPRLTHELDQLRQETKLLQEGIRLVRSDFNTVDSSDTVQALDRLKYLDLVKTRMEATHSALKEAENWRNLEAEANDIFAKGDFTRAATRLSEAERSLVVYKNTKVEGDRMALLLVLKDQLEQQVMGRVKEALEQKDTAACQTLINVFNLIGRQEKFQEYYISQRRAPLVEHWRRLTQAMHVELNQGSAATRSSTDDSKDFLNVLQTFYKDASSMLHDEFAWITSIFVDPSATIHSLVHDIFTCIDPNMQATLQHIAKIHGDEGTLPILISAFATTESFGTRMERIVSQPLVGNQREHTGNRPRAGTLVHDNNAKEGKGPTAHPLRSSFGQEALEIGSIQDPHEWAYVLYEPFMAYQRDYGKLEGAHLRALLSKSVPAMAPYPDNITRSRELAKNSSSLVKIMTNTNSLAFNLAEGAIARCMRLTHGFGAPGLLDGLNTFFKDIMDRYSEILVECRQRSGLQVDESLNNSSSNSGNNNNNNNSVSRQGDLGRSPRLNSKYDNQSGDDDASEDSEGWDEDVNEQDQRLFQMGLRLMVLCRQFCLKLEQLDVKTKKALRGVEDIIRIGQAHQDPHHPGSPLEPGSAGSGLKLNVQPPNASIALLQQSNLNSFRLSEILEIVKKSDLKDSSAQIGGLSGDGTSALNRLSAGTDLGLEPKANHLFLQAHQRAVHLTKLCQRFIFDSVYIPLVRPISDLALLPCWTEGIDQPGQGADSLKGARRVHQSTLGGTRTDVIKFRSSPSEYMEELLRQLLGLPLTFGMYEGDEGLRFGIHSLPYADRPFEAQEQHPDASVSEQPSTLVTGADEGGVGLEDQQSLGVGEAEPGAGLTQGSVEDSEEVHQQQMAEEDDLAVMHRWITSLSRAAMHTIIERLYDPNLGQTKSSTVPAAVSSTSTPPSSHRGRFTGASSPAMGSASPGGSAAGAPKERHYLSRLSEAGAKQLEMDLGYFVDTCLGSLAIEPTPSIRSLIKALRLSESGLLMALQQLQQQQQQQQQKDQEREASLDGSADSPAAAAAATRSKRVSALVEAQSPQVTIAIAGAPVLPSVLAAGEEDLAAQLEQEQKIFEWVARLKGINLPSV
ncbi:unnamed protein product [Mortierella alpina]